MSKGHGNTFLGRYNVLDRSGHLPEGHSWFLRDVFDRLSSDIHDVISMGCSVGINEVIAAIENPQKRFVGIDINPASIDVASSGVWSLDDIKPYRHDSSNTALEKFYGALCPAGYFELDLESNELRLITQVANLEFQCQDGTRTTYPDKSFDLVIAHMFAGTTSLGGTPYHYFLGSEVERLLRDQKYLWHNEGLFKYDSRRDGTDSFYRAIQQAKDVVIERNPTPRNDLFMEPFCWKDFDFMDDGRVQARLE